MTQLKKVCHVTRLWVKSKWGGSETVVYNVAQELIRNGIDSPIFCTNILDKVRMEENNGVTIHRFPYVFPWFGLDMEAKRKLELKGGSPLSLPLFQALMREKNLSIIHAHVQLRLGGCVRTAARLRGIPYVVSIHGGHFSIPKDQSEKMREPFKDKLEWGKIFGFLVGSRRVLKDADAILCVSREEFQLMKERFPKKNVFYLPNGVNIEVFENADASRFRTQYNIGDQEKLIVCVSRIDYQKNQLLLVRAFARFSKNHPEFRLILIGGVSVEGYYNEIEKTAGGLGIMDKMTIIRGLLPNDPILHGAFKSAHIFVLPTSHEPFGIVILEAMAAGVPVIATRIGGIPGFTHNEKDILLFDDKDEEMLLAKMELLAKNDDLRQQLIEEAKRTVKGFDWVTIGIQLQDIYNFLIDSKS